MRHASLTPISWPKFKTFLRQNPKNSQTFVDNIYTKLIKDFQYQNKEVWDLAAYFKHLQSIFLKFNIRGACDKDNLICHFWKDLKPSIRGQMEQLDKELDIWDVLISKAIAVESKTGLQPSYLIQDMDSHCLHSNWSAHNTNS